MLRRLFLRYRLSIDAHLNPPLFSAMFLQTALRFIEMIQYNSLYVSGSLVHADVNRSNSYSVRRFKCPGRMELEKSGLGAIFIPALDVDGIAFVGMILFPDKSWVARALSGIRGGEILGSWNVGETVI